MLNINRRYGSIKLYDTAHLLFLMVIFSFLVGYSPVSFAAPPIPARIGGSVTVNGTLLQKGQDVGYIFEVTIRQSDKSFIPAAVDKDGLNQSNWYVIDIPTYDPKKQPEGGKANETVIIHVLRNGEELKVISPPAGKITIGPMGSTMRVDLIIVSKEPKIKK